MKHEKISPKGRSDVTGREACKRGDLRAPLQKKMKRYIVASKMVDVRAKARMWGEERREVVEVDVVVDVVGEGSASDP